MAVVNTGHYACDMIYMKGDEVISKARILFAIINI